MIKLALFAFAILACAACSTRAQQADPAAEAIARLRQGQESQRLAPPPIAFPITPDLTHAAQAAISAMLKDPNSAMWGPEMRAFQSVSTPGAIDVCGDANAKNSYGGYAGTQPFFVTLARGEGSDWKVLDADIATPGKRGYFFDFAKVCNPINWR